MLLYWECLRSKHKSIARHAELLITLAELGLLVYSVHAGAAIHLNLFGLSGFHHVGVSVNFKVMDYNSNAEFNINKEDII